MKRFLFYFLASFSIHPVSFATSPEPVSLEKNESKLKLDFPVEKYQLSNGLTVLLHENHDVPLISYHTWYRVGSRDESPGVTGAAHMLEHMMFKGAKKYSGKEFDRVLHENGITNNAFTTADFTGFYENLPSSKLELVMDMEVDRMRFLSLKPEDLKSELQVVGEERRWRVDNNPPGLLREAFNNLLYTTHPYRWPVIGTMADIQSYTSEKLKIFYDRFYVPNNAVLVLAGDFDSKRAKEMIQKYYGSLEARPLPVRVYPQEAPVKKPRLQEIEAEVESTTFLIGYPTVASGHPDAYALDLLAVILGQGKSSALYQNLVYKKQSAVNASAFNSTQKDAGYFGASVTMKPKLPWRADADVVREEIKNLRENLTTPRNLRRAKNQVMKDFIDGIEGIDEKAQALAVNEIYFNDFKTMFTDLERYEQVNLSDLRRVAKTYLDPQREVQVVLNPKKVTKP